MVATNPESTRSYPSFCRLNDHGLPVVETHARIAVLCGGRSSEREVSLRSGKNCYEALQRLGYQHTVLVEVDERLPEYLLHHRIDVCFMAVHGEGGEDGALQGLLEILNIPYTGNRIEASAITMNKDTTKRLLQEAGLPVLPSMTFHWNSDEGADLDLLERIMNTVGFPLMVKPLGLGSSVGMSKVATADTLADALDLAAPNGGLVMVERFAKGQDVTVGVIQYEGRLKVCPILEIRPKTDWYDFEAKYTHGMTEFILPAELPHSTTARVQATALHAHQVLGCHGVSRTDFVCTAEGFYILETNSIPGMTDLSDLPAQAKAMGLSYDELVEAILQTAVQTPVWVAGLPPYPVMEGDPIGTLASSLSTF